MPAVGLRSRAPGAVEARVEAIDGRLAVLVIVDPSEHLGALSSVASENLAAAAKTALQERLPLVCFLASSGADLHEGMAALHGWGRAARALIPGQVGALVRQRWHSPSLSGARTGIVNHRRRESRRARTTSGGVYGSSLAVRRLTRGPVMGFSGPRCLTTMSVGRAPRHNPDHGRGDRYALVTGLKPPTPHATDVP